jgi:hypothetical protein
LAHHTGSGFCRKPWSRCFDVLVASTIGFEVQNPVVWGRLMPVSPETGGHRDQASCPRRGLGHSGGGDVHAVVQTPGRCGSPAVTRAGETASIVGHAWQGGQLPSPAAQDDRGVGLGALAGVGDPDGIARDSRPRLRAVQRWTKHRPQPRRPWERYGWLVR